jgi:hypothetical protein
MSSVLFDVDEFIDDFWGKTEIFILSQIENK